MQDEEGKSYLQLTRKEQIHQGETSCRMTRILIGKRVR